MEEGIFGALFVICIIYRPFCIFFEVDSFFLLNTTPLNLRVFLAYHGDGISVQSYKNLDHISFLSLSGYNSQQLQRLNRLPLHLLVS